jgi:hypothetical protein
VEDAECRAVCVICGRRIDSERPVRLAAVSEKRRTFHVHPDCLKRVAKPGFVGLNDL